MKIDERKEFVFFVRLLEDMVARTPTLVDDVILGAALTLLRAVFKIPPREG